jgi:hypothetical protein
MALLFRGAGTVVGRSEDGLLPATGTIAEPTGVQNGDLELLVAWTDSSTMSVSSAGGSAWTLVSGSPWGTTEKLYVWYRIRQSGDSGPVLSVAATTVFASSSATAIVAWSGVDTTSPIDAVGTASTGSGTAISNGGVTTVAPNAMAVHLFGIGDNGTASGWTFNGSTTNVNERLDVPTAQGNDSQLGAADLPVVGAGATGTAAATASLTSPWVSVTIALKAAALVSPPTIASVTPRENGTSASVTATIPTATSGDRLQAWLIVRSSTRVISAAPSGWTVKVAGQVIGARYWAMYERVVDGTEGSTAVWTLDGTAASSAITIRLTGADPIEQYAASNLNTIASMDPTVTESVQLSVAFRSTATAVAGNGNDGMTPPPGWTEDLDWGIAGTAYLGVAHRELTSGDATDAVSWATATGNQNVTVIIPKAPSVVTGTASLSGSGSLSGTGSASATGTASPSGSGSLSGTGAASAQGAASISGSGTLSAAGAASANGSASASGSGTLAATGSASAVGVATASGTGTLTASGGGTAAGTATLSGAGSLSASGNARASGAASLIGTGSLSATGQTGSAVTVVTGEATLTGSGTLAASGSASASSSALMIGTGALTATHTATAAAAATLMGAGSFLAVGAARATGAASLTGHGSIAASGVRVFPPSRTGYEFPSSRAGRVIKVA